MPLIRTRLFLLYKLLVYRGFNFIVDPHKSFEFPMKSPPMREIVWNVLVIVWNKMGAFESLM